MLRRVWLGLLAVAIVAACGKEESKKTSSVTPTEIPATCPPEHQDLDALFAAAAKPPKPPRPPHVILTGLTPDRGVEGTRVLISGNDFKRKPGTVYFGNRPATVYSWAATGVVAIVPSGMVAGVTDVTVQVPPSFGSNALQFAVKPFVASVSPIEAVNGDTINLTGTSFGSAQGSNKLLVQCQAVTATTWTPTAISFTLPAYATPGTASVVVEVNGVLSDARTFTVRSDEPPPTNDYWVSMAASDTARVAHTTVWTGSKMIVFGGTGQGGASYDPALNTWTAVNTEGAPITQGWGVGVWTGTKMIVWGGSTGDAGGRYDPTTDAWAPVTTAGEPSRRELATAVWTGSRMVVWGGWDSYSASGSIVGGRYDPVADQWQPTTTASAPAVRYYHTAVWTGDEMIVWGGISATVAYLNDGGRYDPAADHWTPVTTQGAPVDRAQHTSVWTGSRMIVYGGANADRILNDGGSYAPTTDAWTPITTASAPAHTSHTAVWTGQDMIIWGGVADSAYSNAGARYNAATDTWAAIATSPLTPRVFPSAVWTGTEMLIWGGMNASGTIYSDGARYRP